MCRQNVTKIFLFQFHDENDCMNYCCLSAVKRWAYTISEKISVDLNITLAAGKHFPLRDNVSSSTVKDESKSPARQGYTNYQLDIDFDSNTNEESHSSAYDTDNTLRDDYQEDELNSTISTNFSKLGKFILTKGCP